MRISGLRFLQICGKTCLSKWEPSYENIHILITFGVISIIYSRFWGSSVFYQFLLKLKSVLCLPNGKNQNLERVRSSSLAKHFFRIWGYEFLSKGLNLQASSIDRKVVFFWSSYLRLIRNGKLLNEIEQLKFKDNVSWLFDFFIANMSSLKSIESGQVCQPAKCVQQIKFAIHFGKARSGWKIYKRRA